MPQLTGPAFVEIQDAYATAQLVTSTNIAVGSFQKLGQRGQTADGRTYRWAQIGAAALVPGNLLQSPANDVQFNAMAVQAAVTVGSTTIPVTLGSTATVANMFVDGTITIAAGTNILGQTFTIIGHDVAAGAATCNFYVLEPVQIALTTSCTATVRKNPYDGVIQIVASGSTQTGVAVGVANIAHAASTATLQYFGWIQTGGPCAVLTNDTSAVGVAMAPSTTAGGVIAAIAGHPIVGTLMEVGVSGNTCQVNLKID